MATADFPASGTSTVRGFGPQGRMPGFGEWGKDGGRQNGPGQNRPGQNGPGQGSTTG